MPTRNSYRVNRLIHSTSGLAAQSLNVGLQARSSGRGPSSDEPSPKVLSHHLASARIMELVNPREEDIKSPLHARIEPLLPSAPVPLGLTEQLHPSV